MKNSIFSLDNKIAQMLLAFGLFLVIAIMLYAFFSKEETRANTSDVAGMNASGSAVDATNSQQTRVPAGSQVESIASNNLQLHDIVSDSVTKHTQGSVTTLHLPDKTRMQANAKYYEGLNAYLEGDYQVAYRHWLKAANSNHAKAYFNLGLLASDTRILENLNGLRDADYYLKKAEKYGYAPATKILSGETVYSAELNVGLKTESDKKINKELSAESTTIHTVLNTINEDTPQLTASTANQAPSSERLSGESWVERQADDYWTIQVRAFRQKNELESFLSQYEFGANTAFFREPTSQGVMYKLVIGSFASRDAASSARGSLPSEVLVEGPWLRRFADIKKTMFGS